MIVLLEAAENHMLGAIATGGSVFLLLMVVLAILVGFGSARPHTRSE